MLHPPKQDVVLKVFAENKYFISQKGHCVQVLHAIIRHDAPGTAGTAAAVPKFFYCLVDFSWCREKFYLLYI